MDLAPAAILAAVIAAALFAWQARIGYSVHDEGFLWYGVRAVRSGDVPMVDFQAYAPLRYYATAALTYLFGDGLLTLRVAAHLALFAALTLAGALGRRLTDGRSWPAAAGLMAMVALWAFPYYKLFDHAAPVALTAAAVLLAVRADRRAHLVYGVLASVALSMGLNHGLYAVVAGGVVGLYCLLRRRVIPIGAALGWGLTGYALGALPLLVLAAVRPALVTWFVELLGQMAQGAVSNIGLPVPWPWRVYPDRPLTALGLSFLLVVGSYAVGVVVAAGGRLTQKREAALVAAVAVGVPYLHHAFSRADAEHLSVAAFPAMVVVFLALRGLWEHRRVGARLAAGLALVALVVVSCYAVYLRHVGWVAALAPEELSPYVVDGVELRVFDHHRRIAEQVDAVAAQLGDDEQVLAMPGIPGVYAQLGRQAPVRALYVSSTSSEEQQRQMIEAIDRPGLAFVVIEPLPFGHREDLEFARTHPLVMAYVHERFQRVWEDTGPLEVYRRVR